MAVACSIVTEGASVVPVHKLFNSPMLLLAEQLTDVFVPSTISRIPVAMTIVLKPIYYSGVNHGWSA
jgi:hypothetical protein